MGYANPKVGSSTITNWEHVMGDHGLGMMYENDRFLAIFVPLCRQRPLAAHYFHIKQHTWNLPMTYRHPNRSFIHKPNLVSLSRAMRSADIGSDHHLSVGQIQIKVASMKTFLSKQTQWLKSSLLNSQAVLITFNNEIMHIPTYR